MNSCDEIVDMLPLYLNGNLSKSDIYKVLSHVAKCENCRKELSFIVSVNKLANEAAENVPESILSSAFSKIPAGNSDSAYTLSDVFSIINDVFYITRKTIKLSLSN